MIVALDADATGGAVAAPVRLDDAADGTPTGRYAGRGEDGVKETKKKKGLFCPHLSCLLTLKPVVRDDWQPSSVQRRAWLLRCACVGLDSLRALR